MGSRAGALRNADTCLAYSHTRSRVAEGEKRQRMHDKEGNSLLGKRYNNRTVRGRRKEAYTVEI